MNRLTPFTSPLEERPALRLTRVRQSFARPVLHDIDGAVKGAVTGKLTLPRGGRVAIAVGSRGIRDLDRMVRATVRAVRERGGEPFIIPSMGSHGGGTAEGQRAVLAGYGVTESAMGCPILASMDVVETTAAGSECREFMNRHASESDAVILINRVKPHTDFHGRYGSGLVKMAVIGLGNAAQAAEIHRHGVRGLAEVVPRIAARVFASGKVALGLAIVENAYDEPMIVEAIEPERILEREHELLATAATHMPRLPVDRLDVLIVDRMGKDISGVGIDTNIIGRMYIRGQPEQNSPDIAMIVVDDLTDASHGNAAGMGLADVTTRRMVEKIDFRTTNVNVATSGFLERGKLPMVADTAAEAVEWALLASGPHIPGAERVIRIRDTLHLAEMYVSPAVLAEIEERDDVEVLGSAAECFDEAGELRDF